MSETVLHTGYCWWRGQAAAHTRLTPTDRGPRRRGAGWSRHIQSPATFPTAEALCEAKNGKLFTNARKKVSFLLH